MYLSNLSPGSSHELKSGNDLIDIAGAAVLKNFTCTLSFLPSHVFSRPPLENEQSIIKALHFCRAKMISKETSKHTVNSEVTV